SIRMAQSSTGQLEATPLSSSGGVLGGKLACTWEWSTTNNTVAISSTGRKATVTGLPGTSATVFAKCGDVGNQIVITVKGSQDAGTDAPSDAPPDAPGDSSSDASDG